MQQFFKELFEYSHLCNQKLSEVFENQPDKTSEKAVRLFHHILNAHHIWNHRIEMKQPAFGVWDLHANQDLKSLDRFNLEYSLLLLEKRDLHEIIAYTTSKGLALSNSIQEILFHIINHSTYHRGQIASEFRQNGLEPLVTDYIFFKR